MEYKHLRFEEVDFGKDRKTKLFQVSFLYDSSKLGIIKWYGDWRQYVFEPINDTRWSWYCLQELSNFIKMLIDARKLSQTNSKLPNLNDVGVVKHENIEN